MSKLPTPEEAETITLAEARQHNRDEFDKGTSCWCCGQRVQRYKYKLYATSAIALIHLYKLGEGYHHISQYAEATEKKPRSPHFAELRFWGLIQQAPDDEPDPKKKSSGYWGITKKGEAFVKGDIQLQSRILVFNNTFCGFSDKSFLIDIREALENKFDYSELMGYSA